MIKILTIIGIIVFSFAAANAAESTVFHRPADFLQSIQGDSDAGQKIYEEFCASCHAPKPMINVKAPRRGVQSEWKPYLNQTMDTLLRVVDSGLNQMPPRGGCFECSDADLKAAIEYMLPTASHKKVAP